MITLITVNLLLSLLVNNFWIWWLLKSYRRWICLMYLEYLATIPLNDEEYITFNTTIAHCTSFLYSPIAS